MWQLFPQTLNYHSLVHLQTAPYLLMTLLHLLQTELTYTSMAPSDRWLMKGGWLFCVWESVGTQMHICGDMACFSFQGVTADYNLLPDDCDVP